MSKNNQSNQNNTTNNTESKGRSPRPAPPPPVPCPLTPDAHQSFILSSHAKVPEKCNANRDSQDL